MATLAIATVAFLKGYMWKESSDNTSFEQWSKDTGPVTYYNAIADAEHRNRPGSRFIRALHAGGSGTTAYGPVQLNRQYLQDFTKGGRYASALKDDATRNYVTNLERQAQLFAQHGNTGGKSKGYSKEFDYINKGGTGTGIMGGTPSQQEQYKKAAIEMMKHRVNKEFGGDWNKYLVKHRGRTEQQDPEYYKAYKDSLQKQYKEYVGRQNQRRRQMAAPTERLLTSK